MLCCVFSLFVASFSLLIAFEFNHLRIHALFFLFPTGFCLLLSIGVCVCVLYRVLYNLSDL